MVRSYLILKIVRWPTVVLNIFVLWSYGECFYIDNPNTSHYFIYNPKDCFTIHIFQLFALFYVNRKINLSTYNICIAWFYNNFIHIEPKYIKCIIKLFEYLCTSPILLISSKVITVTSKYFPSIATPIIIYCISHMCVKSYWKWRSLGFWCHGWEDDGHRCFLCKASLLFNVRCARNSLKYN